MLLAFGTFLPLGFTLSTQDTVGGVVSWTVTLELQELEFPEPSVALQSTCVVPNGKLFPDAGQLVEAKPQLSEPTALKETTAPLGPVHSTGAGAGHVIAGGESSTTVTVAVQEAIADKYQIEIRPDIRQRQKDRMSAWLGVGLKFVTNRR